MQSQNLINKSGAQKKSDAWQRKSAQQNSHDMPSHPYDALENANWLAGDLASAAQCATVIQRQGLLHRRNDSRRVQTFLRLQRLYGNQFVQRVIAQHAIQAKLKIGQPGDIYEQEADRIAEQVMKMAEPPVQRQPEEEEEKEEEEELQMKASPGQIPDVGPDIESRINAMKGGGQPLPVSTRAFFEPRFGYDFSQVRVHNDVRAVETARTLNARAFTTGRDVVFGGGRYAPETVRGRQLLAHELVHTIQQSAFGRRFCAVQYPVTIMRLPEQTGSESLTERVGLSASKIPRPTLVRAGGGIAATVYFAQNDFLLDSLSFELAQTLSEELRFVPNPRIIVDGHASTEGTIEYNRDLSEHRRLAVIAVLRSKLIGTPSFGGKAYGESKPAVEEKAKTSAELEHQRAQNRRAVIWIMPTPAVGPTKPIGLSLPTRAPTPDEELGRIMKEPPVPPPPKRSLSEMVREKFDDAMEDILRKAGVPPRYREPIKEGARNLMQTGLQEALDAALDQTGLSDAEKRAIKEAIKATSETKF